MPEGKRNETLETHIGIVGTEAKINQEELVKSRRKIWSVPVALSLVLLFALALGVSQYVAAQTTNAAPVPFDPGVAATPITVVIGPAGITATQGVDGETVTITQAMLFTDAESDAMVFTAMTSNPDAVRPVFQNQAITRDADGEIDTITPGLVQAWWDALDNITDPANAQNTLADRNCNAKAARLGFAVGVDGPDEDEVPDNQSANPDGDPAVPDATGLCADFTALADDEAREMVVVSFHWDMLDGAEMVSCR